MERAFRRTMDALEPVFSFLEECAQSCRLDAATAFNLQLAVEEVFTNLVKYNAQGGSDIAIRVEREENRLQVVLIDADADFFDPWDQPDPQIALPLADRPVGGLGLFIVRQVMDTVEYAYHDRRSIVTLTKTVAS